MLTRIAGVAIGIALFAWVGLNFERTFDQSSPVPSSNGALKFVRSEKPAAGATPIAANGAFTNMGIQPPVQYPLKPFPVREGNEEGAMDDAALEPPQPSPPPPPRPASRAIGNESGANTSDYHGEGADDDDASSKAIAERNASEPQKR